MKQSYIAASSVINSLLGSSAVPSNKRQLREVTDKLIAFGGAHTCHARQFDEADRGDSAPEAPLEDLDPHDFNELMLQVVKARELARYFADELTDSLCLLTDATALNADRLYDEESGKLRKPRISLWADLDPEGTLSIFCEPRADEQGHVDFVGFPSYPEPLPVVRLSSEEFEACPALALKSGATAPGITAICGALEDSLELMAGAMMAVLDVELKSWPVYSKSDNLEILDAEERVFDYLGGVLQRGSENLLLQRHNPHYFQWVHAVRKELASRWVQGVPH